MRKINWFEKNKLVWKNNLVWKKQIRLKKETSLKTFESKLKLTTTYTLFMAIVIKSSILSYPNYP